MRCLSELVSESLADVKQESVTRAQWKSLQEYKPIAVRVQAIIATQERLACEGHFEGRSDYKKGIFDWQTHEALAEFERRHRVFGWGFIGRDTIKTLRQSPAEAEREAVVRVLTERVVHAAGALEDGSVHSEDNKKTYTNAAGEVVPVRNLTAELHQKVIDAFGLQTPESTYAWLQGLGDLTGRSCRRISRDRAS